MKVICMPQKREIVIKELPRPEPQSGMALVKIKMCGICGSDLTAYEGTNPTNDYPIDGIGHEGVGIIEEIGDNNRGLKKGDPVALEPYVPCNSCPMCKAKRYNNCENLKVAGVHTNGMMAEYFLHPVSLLYKLPDTLGLRRAALVEPLTIGLHALTRSKVKSGEFCVIFGAGPIGLLAGLGCLSYGATPILVDILQKRLDAAKDCGIKLLYNSSEGRLEEYLRDVCGGVLADSMLDCTGSQAVIANMHNMVRHGGHISLVGWPHEPVTVNTIRCMRKELDIHTCRNSCAKFPEAINLVNSGAIPADKIISRTIKMEEAAETIQDMVNNPTNYIKVVVEIE